MALIINIWNLRTAKDLKKKINKLNILAFRFRAGAPRPCRQKSCHAASYPSGVPGHMPWVSPRGFRAPRIQSLSQQVLTSESGILIHPITNDGSEDQNRPCHHQPVDRSQEEAVSIELYQEHRHGKVPHPVSLQWEKRKCFDEIIFIF